MKKFICIFAVMAAMMTIIGCQNGQPLNPPNADNAQTNVKKSGIPANATIYGDVGDVYCEIVLNAAAGTFTATETTDNRGDEPKTFQGSFFYYNGVLYMEVSKENAQTLSEPIYLSAPVSSAKLESETKIDVTITQTEASQYTTAKTTFEQSSSNGGVDNDNTGDNGGSDPAKNVLWNTRYVITRLTQYSADGSGTSVTCDLSPDKCEVEMCFSEDNICHISFFLYIPETSFHYSLNRETKSFYEEYSEMIDDVSADYTVDVKFSEDFSTLDFEIKQAVQSFDMEIRYSAVFTKISSFYDITGNTYKLVSALQNNENMVSNLDGTLHFTNPWHGDFTSNISGMERMNGSFSNYNTFIYNTLNGNFSNVDESSETKTGIYTQDGSITFSSDYKTITFTGIGKDLTHRDQNNNSTDMGTIKFVFTLVE